MRDLDREFVKRALAAGWITEREERAARRAVAKAHKRGQPLYVAQALVQLGALDCEQLLELGRELGARLYECPRCGHKLPADELPAADESFACARCERPLACDHDVTLSLAEVLTSRDPLDLSVTLADRGGHEGSGSTSASSSLPPFDLERFELKEELGRGAYGVVFRAVQTDLEREVALKVLRPREGELSPVALERFLREGASVARLQHENVIRVFGIGRHKDLYVLNMELVRGQSLKALLQAAPGQPAAVGGGPRGRARDPARDRARPRPRRRAPRLEAGERRDRGERHAPGDRLRAGPRTSRPTRSSPGQRRGRLAGYLSPEQLEHGSSRADARAATCSAWG
ncbi:MAG: protein kinase [Planctomycetota bacterium]